MRGLGGDQEREGKRMERGGDRPSRGQMDHEHMARQNAFRGQADGAKAAWVRLKLKVTRSIWFANR